MGPDWSAQRRAGSPSWEATVTGGGALGAARASSWNAGWPTRSGSSPHPARITGSARVSSKRAAPRAPTSRLRSLRAPPRSGSGRTARRSRIRSTISRPPPPSSRLETAVVSWGDRLAGASALRMRMASTSSSREICSTRRATGPSCSSSPGCSRDRCTRTPFTRVPFRLPRSSTSSSCALRVRRAWRRETPRTPRTIWFPATLPIELSPAGMP